MTMAVVCVCVFQSGADWDDDKRKLFLDNPFIMRTPSTTAVDLQGSVLQQRLRLHRVSKNKQNYFCYNYVKRPPNPTILAQRWQIV